eukprot:630968-Prorocentrum_minimum.AAC.2
MLTISLFGESRLDPRSRALLSEEHVESISDTGAPLPKAEGASECHFSNLLATFELVANGRSAIWTQCGVWQSAHGGQRRCANLYSAIDSCLSGPPPHDEKCHGTGAEHRRKASTNGAPNELTRLGWENVPKQDPKQKRCSPMSTAEGGAWQPNLLIRPPARPQPQRPQRLALH